MRGTRPLTLRWCVTVVAATTVAFVAAEITASFLLPPGPRFVEPQIALQPDVRRGFSLRPGVRSFTHDKPFITNSLGVRDEREVPADKGGEFRILALGDSITEGQGVRAEDTFARQLESRLRRSIVRLRCVNGGVGQYGTWQSMDVLREKGARVQPNIVTLTFYWDDLYLKPGHVTPKPVNAADGRQVSVMSYLRLLKRSRVLLILRAQWNRLWTMIDPDFDSTLRDGIFRGVTSPYLERAWDQFARDVADLRNLEHELGFTAILLVVPMPEQVRQPEYPPVYMQQRVMAIASKAGIRSLDLLPPLRRAYADRPNLYIPWDDEHFAPRAHEVVADALETYLRRERLIKDARDDAATAALARAACRDMGKFRDVPASRTTREAACPTG